MHTFFSMYLSCLSESGKLFSFGCGSEGQLGHGDCEVKKSFCLIHCYKDNNFDRIFFCNVEKRLCLNISKKVLSGSWHQAIIDFPPPPPLQCCTLKFVAAYFIHSIGCFSLFHLNSSFLPIPFI